MSAEERSRETPLVMPNGSGDATSVSEDEIAAMLEALLFVAPEPVTLRDLADATGYPVSIVDSALARLEAAGSRGLVVVRHKETAHLASAPRFAPQVRRLLRLEREQKLSGAALETIALVAYRQPVTRAEIESLRGVDCSAVLSTLHAKGLIEVAGRLPTVGNPIQYATSPEFLRHFGLRSLSELPPIESLVGGDAARLLQVVDGSDSDQVVAETTLGESG
jgi:segregation and condensation protein B